MFFWKSAVGQPKKGRSRYLYPLKLPRLAKSSNRSLDKRYPRCNSLNGSSRSSRRIGREGWQFLWQTSGQLLWQILSMEAQIPERILLWILLTNPINLDYHYSIASWLQWTLRLLLFSSNLQFSCVETLLSSLRSAAPVSPPSVVAPLLYISQLCGNSPHHSSPFCGTPTWLLSSSSPEAAFSAMTCSIKWNFNSKLQLE